MLGTAFEFLFGNLFKLYAQLRDVLLQLAGASTHHSQRKSLSTLAIYLSIFPYLYHFIG